MSIINHVFLTATLIDGVSGLAGCSGFHPDSCLKKRKLPLGQADSHQGPWVFCEALDYVGITNTPIGKLVLGVTLAAVFRLWTPKGGLTKTPIRMFSESGRPGGTRVMPPRPGGT